MRQLVVLSRKYLLRQFNICLFKILVSFIMLSFFVNSWLLQISCIIYELLQTLKMVLGVSSGPDDSSLARSSCNCGTNGMFNTKTLNHSIQQTFWYTLFKKFSLVLQVFQVFLLNKISRFCFSTIQINTFRHIVFYFLH